MSATAILLLAGMWLFTRCFALSVDAALSRISLERARELSKDSKAGMALFQIKAAPEDLAGTLRAFITFPLVLAACLVGDLGSRLILPASLGPAWARFGPPLGMSIGGVVLGLVVTAMDLIGRSLGIASDEGFALFLAPQVRMGTRISAPVLRAVSAALDVVLAPLGAKVRFAQPAPPLEEIERLLAEEAGKRVDQKAPALIHSIFEMSEKTARDVMVPRTEIVAVEMGTPPEELIRMLEEEGHSRLPVYRGDLDHLVGVLHARDLVPMITSPQLIVLHDLVRPATFIPWSKPIGDLLREMQKKRIHMAMVVDEYGGFMGMVTLEDILEEIVGEIGNEYSEKEKVVEQLADGSFVVQGAISVSELNVILGVEIPEGEYETLGGYLNSLAGAIPDVGDRFFFGGLQFVVSDRTSKQVRRVRVSRVKKVAATGRPAGVPETH